MNDPTDLIDRYIAMWNETDAGRRQALVARTWTESCSYLDPALQGDGPADVAAMVARVQARFPGHSMRRTSAIDSHHDRIRFSWALAPDGGPVAVSGIDFGIVAPDGRLQAITGFFDTAATAA